MKTRLGALILLAVLFSGGCGGGPTQPSQSVEPQVTAGLVPIPDPVTPVVTSLPCRPYPKCLAADQQ